MVKSKVNVKVMDKDKVTLKAKTIYKRYQFEITTIQDSMNEPGSNCL